MIAKNLKNIQDKISASSKKAGRSPSEVQLLAVSKTFSTADILAAWECGQKSFAENYAQEFILKKQELQHLPIDWHFIGHLQTNKIKSVVNQCSLIHSVDSEKSLLEMNKRATSPQKFLIEVNLAGESTKSGMSPQGMPQLLERVQECENLRLQGLMLMPPLENSAERNRPLFEKLREFATQWGKNLSSPHFLREFSMGTSQDYVVAVECGATIVRLGTTVFGERKSNGR